MWQDSTAQHDPEAVAVAIGAGGSMPVDHDLGPYRDAGQQAASAKLGMWLFLATEVMMFGGLFCVYAILRASYPETFDWGHRFLDTGWGLINTVVLLISSFTVVMALQCAKWDQQTLQGLFLVLTVICGILFLGVKAIEYEHKVHDGLLWASAFAPPAPETEAGPPVVVADDGGEAAVVMTPQLAMGRQLYERSCASCHGREGYGLPGMGLPLAGSAFVTERGDGDVVAFLKEGRMPGSPDSRMNLVMPARGGNPALTDGHLGLIVQYLRTFEPPSEAEAEAAAVQVPGTMIPAAAPARPGISDWMRQQSIEQGVGGQFLPPDPGHDPVAVPARAGLFFSIYFLTTGLHAVHMVIGIGLMLWLAVRTWRGDFSSDRHTAVEIGGLYWHLVDMIWLMIFPLFYLIH